MSAKATSATKVQKGARREESGNDNDNNVLVEVANSSVEGRFDRGTATGWPSFPAVATTTINYRELRRER